MSTPEDIAYATVVNMFGTDPETPEEHEILARFRHAAEQSHWTADAVADYQAGIRQLRQQLNEAREAS